MVNILSSMDDVLQFVVAEILESGQTASPRGYPTREILGCSFRLTNPRARKIAIPARKWSFEYAVGELCWHLAGRKDVGSIAYYSNIWRRLSDDGQNITGSCYGNKIFVSSGTQQSQWDSIINILSNDIFSRRAVISLASDISFSEAASVDVPCISTIQFIYRDGALNCLTTMRSNDAILGLCYDVFFVTMLQELLCLMLNMKIGWYQHNSGSTHLYAKHYELARAIYNTKHACQSEPMKPMSSVESIPLFIEVERLLRVGESLALSRAQNLPEYWHELAQPLIQKAARTHMIG